jgi:hypothetical protein
MGLSPLAFDILEHAALPNVPRFDTPLRLPKDRQKLLRIALHPTGEPGHDAAGPGRTIA